MKSMKKILTCTMTFVLGVMMVISCGGGAASIAQSIEDATAALLAFDNSGTDLDATNVQDAIVEVNDRVVAVDSTVVTDSNFVGTWTGTAFSDGSSTGVSVTLNADGSYSCSSDVAATNYELYSTSPVCDNAISWESHGSNIAFTYTDGSSTYSSVLVLTNYSASRLNGFISGGPVTTNGIYALTKL